MKKLTSYVLLLLYVSVSFNLFLPAAAYYLNIRFIAEELCEKNASSGSKCNGRCYLAREMEKQMSSKKSEKEAIVPDFFEIPHILLTIKKSLNNLPQLKSYYVLEQFQSNLITKVHTPPPKQNGTFL
jgi:hypothetical protein